MLTYNRVKKDVVIAKDARLKLIDELKGLEYKKQTLYEVSRSLEKTGSNDRTKIELELRGYDYSFSPDKNTLLKYVELEIIASENRINELIDILYGGSPNITL